MQRTMIIYFAQPNAASHTIGETRHWKKEQPANIKSVPPDVSFVAGFLVEEAMQRHAVINAGKENVELIKRKFKSLFSLLSQMLW